MTWDQGAGTLRWQTISPETSAAARPSSPRLPIRSLPLPDENIKGWLLRLATRNGLTGGWRDPLRAAGLHRGALDRPRVIQALARLVGAQVDEIDWIVPAASFGKMRPSGLPGRLEYSALLFRREAQICPECLAGRGHVPAVWDLSAWTACPIHRCAMVEACHRCDKPISYHRPALDRCECRARLSEAPRSPPGDDVVELSRLVAAKAGVLGSPQKSRIGPPVADLDLGQLLWTAATFRISDDPNNQVSPDVKADARNAAAAMLDWPAGYHRYLARIRQDGGAEPRLNVLHEYNLYCSRLYAGLKSATYAPSARLLLEELKQDAHRRWDTDPSLAHLRPSNRTKPGTGLINGTAVALALGTTHKRVAALVERGDLRAEKRRVGSTERLIVRQSDLEAFLERAAPSPTQKRERGLISIADAAHALGSAKRTIQPLVESGRLEVTELRDPAR